MNVLHKILQSSILPHLSIYSPSLLLILIAIVPFKIDKYDVFPR